MFCGHCGAEIDDNHKFCPKCGKSVSKTEQQDEPIKDNTGQSIQDKTQMELTTKRSNFWYILPIIFGVLGGVIAYFILRKTDPQKAKICLFVGIGISVIYFAAIAASGSNDSNSQSTIKETIPATPREIVPQSSPPPPKVTPEKTDITGLDPLVIASAKKNIPIMQSLPKEILTQCQNVNSYSDYQIFILAVALLEDELLENINNIDAALTVLELQGYGKHPEVGPLIKETRSISAETTECLEDIVRKYG